MFVLLVKTCLQSIVNYRFALIHITLQSYGNCFYNQNLFILFFVNLLMPVYV